jgi:CHAD domain-containing protein
VGDTGKHRENEAELPRHLAKALKTRWRRYRKALQRCQRKFTETAVHDSRIETRRMLSILELLGAFLPESHLKKSRRLLKRHLDSFAEVRDTQVQLLLVASLVSKFPELAAFQALLRRRERRGIKEARKKIKRVPTARLHDLIGGLRRELRSLHHHQARRASGDAVARAFAEVQSRRRRIQADDTGTIHRTRVAFKHFRYMVEGLAGTLPGLTRARLRAMQAYQTLMGEIQDCEVFLAALHRYAEKHRPEVATAARWFAELERRKRRLVARYLKRADALNGFWPLPGLAVPARSAR